MPFDFSDRDSLKALRRDIQEALGPVCAKHGIDLDPKMDAKFTSGNVVYSIVFLGGGVGSRAEADFPTYAPLFGLKPEDLGRQFKHGDTHYTLCGLKPSAPRFPVLAKRPDGKVYKFPRFVLQHLQ